jgi:hypothetical protein
MFPNSNQRLSHQLQLFPFEESTSTLELFPVVWKALEDLACGELKQRGEGLEQLLKIDAHRYSPLAAFILASRITERDINLRSQIIQALCSIFDFDDNGVPAPEDVRASLHQHLSDFRNRQIFSLLEVSARFDSHISYVARLLDACPYASNHLIEMISDPKYPIEIRQQGVTMIGKIGYTSAVPALERLQGRLETKVYGQQKMYFASSEPSKEIDLLPTVHEALKLLRAP